MNWTITPEEEETQSATYMPLICSVIDGFTVTFPSSYENIFNSTVEAYNYDRAEDYGKLPFKNFKEFQAILKRNTRRIIGGSTPDHFRDATDKPYHIIPDVQTEIIDELDIFLRFFISNLKEFIPGERCTLTLEVRADGRAEERVERWYWIDDDGSHVPYSDEINEQLNLGEEFAQPIQATIRSTEYMIHPVERVQLNIATNKTRRIVKRGGKIKRIRTKSRRTIRKNKKTKKIKYFLQRVYSTTKSGNMAEMKSKTIYTSKAADRGKGNR